MNKNKSFFIAILSLMIVISITLAMIVINVVHLWELRNCFFLLKSELQALLCVSPAPIQKNVVITASNLEGLYKIRNEWYHALGIMPSSQTPIECYLNIQKAVELIKTQAKVANVAINSKCHFGFFQYLNGERLPSVKSIYALSRQCQIIKILLAALIESSPKEILEAIREPIIGELDIEDNLSNVHAFPYLKIHDIFYSNVFKLSFTGTTQVLRLFINKIEHMQIPLFIRNIQVAKAIEGGPSFSVNEALTVFSITLEFLDFKAERL